jgi:hypothetical protein
MEDLAIIAIALDEETEIENYGKQKKVNHDIYRPNRHGQNVLLVGLYRHLSAQR